MYIANNTRPNIAFSVNFLPRYNSFPTWRHWNEIKRVFHYMQGTMEISLFYSNITNYNSVRYANT